MANAVNSMALAHLLSILQQGSRHPETAPVTLDQTLLKMMHHL